MRGLLSKAPGGPETLEIGELPDPTPGAGEVVIAVKACAINYPDVLVIEDKYQFKPPRPFAPGGEVSGVVEQVGEGVTQLKVGDRVMGNTGMGGLSERLLFKEAALYPIPEERSFEEAAALLLTYGTTIHALVDRGHIREGDNLLVLGAAGGVGLAAVELGKAFGARVVGAVSSEEKAQAVRDAGADEVVAVVEPGRRGIGGAPDLEREHPAPAATEMPPDGHTWTDDADEELRDGVDLGLDLDELSESLELPAAVIEARLVELGLTLATS